MSHLLFAIIAFVLIGPIQNTVERDLNRYERIGPLTVSLGQNPEAVQSRVREFIWTHWQNKKLGYAVVTFYSKEGETSASHIFIEPDGNNRWQLAVKIERQLSDRRGVTDPKYRGKIIDHTDQYTAYSLERVLTKKGSFYLPLKDEAGKLITNW